MVQDNRVSWLGLGIVAFGLFVLLYAIPNWVTSPSNVRAIVLSPTFWPIIVAWLIIGLGALVVVMRLLGFGANADPFGAQDEEPHPGAAAWLRLVASGLLMVGVVLLTPTLGLVLTSILAFAALSVIIRASRPVLSGLTAILLPLVLYAFFNHVAGVAIPQGELIRLP